MKKLLFSIFATLLCMIGHAQVLLQSSDLPIVIINTQGQTIPDEPKITALMGIIDNGPGVRNNVSDPHNGYSGYIGIELRGSTSQFFSDKKPYAVETRNEDGSNLNVSLLGMPAENDWVFLAPYSDKSLMRDVLTYIVASRMMAWAPRARFVELLVNNEYQGVYAIIERIKRDKNRVDIKKLGAEHNAGDSLTGGYILKIDKTTGSNNDGFLSQHSPTAQPDKSIWYYYHYPKPDEITNAQKSYIQQFIHNFENVMASPSYQNPETGYHSIIDVESFVDFFIVNEITRNVDGYRLSTFLYKDRDSKDARLKMGPVWDFNISLGNADYCSGGATTGWACDFNSVCHWDNWLIPFYWDKLRQDPLFRAHVRHRWDNLRTDLLSTASLWGMIDSMKTTLNESQARNFQRWPILGHYVWPNNYVGQTYNSEVNYLKAWLHDRMVWLDNQIANFPLLPSALDENSQYAVQVFPNPVSAGSPLTISLDCADNGQEHILQVYDLMGKKVYSSAQKSGHSGCSFTWAPASSGVFVYSISKKSNPIARGKIYVK